ncbi:hypothetical protein HRI_000527100 [Hibiscus trionum]|uniref:Uncharacterized protein n=1 Tax=Hibiscus trionum TaxID=183268 RepID=A0A9W7H0L8_HIBTR|nr:hypothetical protein HRI_000527100 [Hibiscus trionum]
MLIFNVLIDLYKKCGRVDEQTDLIKRNLRLINHGEIFNGKPTKTARSHGPWQEVSSLSSTRNFKITGEFEVGLHAKIKLPDNRGGVSKSADDRLGCQQGMQLGSLFD